MTSRCPTHNALRTRMDRNGIASLAPAERGELARCPCCGPEIVAVQDALGDLVGLGSLEPDLDDDVDLRGPTIPIDTSTPNAFMREDAPPARRRFDVSSLVSAAIVLLLAVIAAIVI